jgi:hypothetical protein
MSAPSHYLQNFVPNAHQRFRGKLAKDMEQLTDKVVRIMTARQRLAPQADKLLADLFALRIAWWAAAPAANKGANDLVAKLEAMATQPQFAAAADNALFALEWSARLHGALNAVMPSQSVPLPRLPSYDQVVVAVQFTMPDEEATTRLGLLDSSLRVDFGILALLLLTEGNPKASPAKLRELGVYLNQAAHDYAGWVLRVLPHAKQALPGSDGPITRDALAEAREMAEIGISEWAETLDRA